MVLLGLSGHMYWKPKKASVKTWTILKLSSKWHSVALDFLLNHLCGPSRWWIVLTGGNHGSTKGPRVLRPATSNPLPVCPLRYIGAGTQFRLEGGNEGSLALLSPTCGIAGFLTYSGVLCKGACEAMRNSKKQWPRYSMTLIVMNFRLVLYVSRFSSWKCVGGTTRAAARPAWGRLLYSLSPRASNQAHPPPLNRWELVLGLSYVILVTKNEAKNEAGCYQNSITSHLNPMARPSQR